MAKNYTGYLLHLTAYLDGRNYNYTSDILSPISKKYDTEYLNVKLLPFQRQFAKHPVSKIGFFYLYDAYSIVISLENKDGDKLEVFRSWEEKNTPIVVTEGNRIAIELFVTPSSPYYSTAEEREKADEKAIIQGPILLNNFISRLIELTTRTESIHIEGIQTETKAYLMNLFAKVPRYELCLYQYSAFGDEIVNAYLRGSLFDRNSDGVTILNDILSKWKASKKIFPLTAQLHTLGFVDSITEIKSSDVGNWLEAPSTDKSGNRKYTDEQIAEACELFIKDLNTIIQGAPKLPFDYVVFRGVYNDYHIRTENVGFLSTSTSSNVAKEFTNGVCCFMIIRVPKGSPFLLIPQKYSYYTQEVEVLFPSSTQLVLTNDESISYNGIESYMYDMKLPKNNSATRNTVRNATGNGNATGAGAGAGASTGGRRKRQTRKRKGRSRKYRK